MCGCLWLLVHGVRWNAATGMVVGPALGRCDCAASVISWSVVAAGWPGKEEGSVARSMPLSFQR